METAAEQQPDTNSQCISSSLKPSRITSSKLDLDGARNNIHAKKGNVGFDCTQQREEDPGAENSLNTATNLSKEGGLRYRQTVADLGFEPRVCLGKTSRYNMVQFNMQFGNITTKFSK